MWKNFKTAATIITLVGGLAFEFWLWVVLAMTPQEAASKTMVWVREPYFRPIASAFGICIIAVCLLVLFSGTASRTLSKAANDFRWRLFAVIVFASIVCLVSTNQRRYEIAIAIVLAYLTIGSSIRLYFLKADFDFYARPRGLTSRQIAAFVSLLSKMKARPITVKAAAADREATHFASQIVEALKRAGWPVESDFRDQGDTSFAEGLYIREVGSTGDMGKPEDKWSGALFQAMKKTVYFFTGASRGQGPEPYELNILVGRRPFKLYLRIPWRYRLTNTWNATTRALRG